MMSGEKPLPSLLIEPGILSEERSVWEKGRDYYLKEKGEIPDKEEDRVVWERGYLCGYLENLRENNGFGMVFCFVISGLFGLLSGVLLVSIMR